MPFLCEFRCILVQFWRLHILCLICINHTLYAILCGLHCFSVYFWTILHTMCFFKSSKNSAGYLKIFVQEIWDLSIFFAEITKHKCYKNHSIQKRNIDSQKKNPINTKVDNPIAKVFVVYYSGLSQSCTRCYFLWVFFAHDNSKLWFRQDEFIIHMTFRLSLLHQDVCGTQ